MKSIFLTDRGQVRKHNEDSGGIFYNASNQLLAIIADGMGGHQSGDVASQMAVSMMKDSWTDAPEFTSPKETEEWLTNTVQHINKTIYNRSEINEELMGMGTTIVIVIFVDEFITVGHIGDSRCYIQNQNGFKQITEDHSLVNILMRAGQITSEDAQNHPRKNIVSRALGTEDEVELDIQSLTIEEDNKILICSDGLTDKVINDELESFIKAEESLDMTGQKLIDLANERGGEDNISLIFLHLKSTPQVGDEPC